MKNKNSNKKTIYTEVDRNFLDIDGFHLADNKIILTNVARTDKKEIVIENGKIHLPETVTKLGSCAFCELPLEEFDFEKTNIKTVEDCAFEGTQLRNINVPSDLDTMYAGGLFKDCKDLEKVSFAASCVPSVCFKNCCKLQDIEIKEGVTRIETEAFEKTAIEKLLLPKSLKWFDLTAIKNTKIHELVFQGEPRVTCSEDNCLDVKDSLKFLSKESWLGLLKLCPVVFAECMPSEHFDDEDFIKQCEESMIQGMLKRCNLSISRSVNKKICKTIAERKKIEKEKRNPTQELPYEEFLRKSIEMEEKTK